MSKESEEQVTVNVMPKILLPAPVATVIGGAAAYLCATPAVPGLWGLAAAVATGVATGYGARWGRTLFARAGKVVGGVTGFIAGGGLAAIFSDKGNKIVNSVTGAGVGAMGGAALFKIGGAVVGSIAGGVFAYNVAKVDIDEWALSHVDKHAASEQSQPARAAENAAFQKDGKTYHMVVQNG